MSEFLLVFGLFLAFEGVVFVLVRALVGLLRLRFD